MPLLIRNGWKAAGSPATADIVSSYHPIDHGLTVSGFSGELIGVRWRGDIGEFSVDFQLSHDETKAVRVSFDQQCIVRILDEMALSTDDAEKVQGIVPGHFAYEVEGAAFAATQSSAWKEALGPVRHYQFVTDWACVDVLSASEPVFELVTALP